MALIGNHNLTCFHRKLNNERLTIAIKNGLVRLSEEKDSVIGKSGKKLAERINPFGYRSIRVGGTDGKTWDFYVHKVVYFITKGQPNEYGQINHKDGNRWNNHPDNLEFISREENLAKREYASQLESPAF